MTRSVAAVLLAALAIAGSAAIVLSGLSRRLRLGFIGGVSLAVLIAAGVAAGNGASDLVEVSGIDSSYLGRPEMWGLTSAAIGTFGVAGAGFGAFPAVFHLFENPELVNAITANHAHNDLLEFVLEGGIPAIALLFAFLIWYGRRFISVWTVERRRDPIAQGASIASLIVLLHSLVDYPLRTAAIATIFGFCLALLAREPASSRRDDAAPEAQPARHLSA